MARALAEPPHLPGLPGFAGKFIPMEQARELYQRVREAPQGFRLEALLAEMKVQLTVHGRFRAHPKKRPAGRGGESSFWRT